MYTAVGPALFSSHTHKILEDRIHHWYLNMLENSIIDDETGDSLEYKKLLKFDKHKHIKVKYVANDLGSLAQVVGEILKGTKTMFFLALKKHQHIGEMMSPMAKLFAITYSNKINPPIQDLRQGATSLVFQEISVQ